ncbi:MAG TPA: protease modulator HflC [Trinickia sp.]|jgi:membrane protease subunit HflC|uniref:protease modulator HflC n=1 Tax=Trinickia sp. TaxID=2571163 RepID=UPI002B521E9D|nr:protease modulator HflC [Trinickia sp.]HTI16226.1 protease modulator HflC [Trinickia sp.]
MNRIVALIVLVVILMFVGSSTLVVVDQRHMAVVYSRGGESPAVVGPGLHFKLPAPLQSALRVDTRIQTLEAANDDRYQTSDRAELLVSPLVKYRIVDPLKLFDKTDGNKQSLADRLTAFTHDALGDAIEKRTLSDALAHQADIAAGTREAMSGSAAALGVDVVDVQLVRVDIPASAAEAVYKRMAAAKAQEASAVRAEGAAEADAIKAAAQRQREAIVADGYQKAQALKGQGDAKAAEIAANAFSRDPSFYQFYQSLQAYRAVFKPGDVIVVDPDSDFFRFMRSPDGGAVSAPGAAQRKH